MPLLVGSHVVLLAVPSGIPSTTPGEGKIGHTWRGEIRTLLSIIFDQLNVIFIVSKRLAGLGSLNHVDVRDRLVEDINYQSTVVIIPPKHAHTCAVLQKYQIRFIKRGSRKAGLKPVKL